MRCRLLSPMVFLASMAARLPQAWLWSLSGMLSWLCWPLLSHRRRVARINIAACFPDLDERHRRRLLIANQRATVMGVLELVRAWYAPSTTLMDMARIEGIEHLQEALAQGRGVLLFTGHFTHTELAVRLLSQALARSIGGVVRRHNAPCLEAEFTRARSRVFGPVFEKKDIRGLLRALQSGQIVVYSADQNFTYQHAFVPFFGIPAATLISTPDLVSRGNAVMLPFWFYRDAGGKYQIRIEQAWPGWCEPNAESAAIYMRELETVIREHPEQYLWMHRRFRTRPPGDMSFY